MEYLVLDADARPRRIDRAASAALAERDPWVSVPTLHPGRVSDHLQEHGLRTPPHPEWLMTVAVAAQRRSRLPGGYTADLRWREPYAAEVRVLDGHGLLAASGHLGLADDIAVPDRILTAVGHRRRGLGAAMMTMLANAALGAGAEHAVLEASEAGRRLYSALGWSVAGAVVVARVS